MVYKRNVTDINSMKKVEYVLSNNRGIYMNTSVIGENFAPYHGLFILQNVQKTEVILSKMCEIIEICGKTYEIKDYRTSEKVYGGSEYLVSFSDEQIPCYEYNIVGCKLEKKYSFSVKENILCVEYRFSNNTSKAVRFMVTPYVTKRKLFEAKRASELKYNCSSSANSVKVNVSISEGKDLFLRGYNLKYTNKNRIEKGINCDYEAADGVTKTFVEDLFIPGDFETVIKAGNTLTFRVYASMFDIENEKINFSDLELDMVEKKRDILQGIDPSYHELRSLAITAHKLNYIDEDKRHLVLLESIPSISENDKYVKNIISSIEGNYLLLKRFKEAKLILEAMMLKLKDEKNILNGLDTCEAELLFIEAVNRYLQESECVSSEIKVFYEYIKSIIYSYVDKKNVDAFMDKDFLICVDKKKYVRINAMWYNAVKIYAALTDKFIENSDYAYSLAENIKSSIIDKFWDNEVGCLKYEVGETPYASIDMIYVLSLSYPILYDKIALKIMDVAFKKLYSPLGMRLGEVGSKLYDGYVYPHLMVHFLKANLRQMGVTRATQKIAYNMVKDLLAEIDKNTLGTVKYRYSEKEKRAYGPCVDALTNAELIRMFDMLT